MANTPTNRNDDKSNYKNNSFDTGKSRPKTPSNKGDELDTLSDALAVALGLLFLGDNSIKTIDQLTPAKLSPGKVGKQYGTGVLGILTNIASTNKKILEQVKLIGQSTKTSDVIQNNKKNTNKNPNQTSTNFYQNSPNTVDKYFNNTTNVICDSFGKTAEKVIDAFKSNQKNPTGNKPNGKQDVDVKYEVTVNGTSVEDVNKVLDRMDEAQKQGFPNQLIDTFDNFTNTTQKANEAVSTAVEGTVDPEAVNRTIEIYIDYAKILKYVLLIGGLFLLVGLISEKINYGAVLKFSAILLSFIGSIISTAIFTNSILGGKIDIFNDMASVLKAVIILGTMLTVIGLLANFMDVAALSNFVTTLSMFLLALAGIMWVWNKIVKDVEDGLLTAAKAVTLAAFVLLTGALVFKYLDVSALMGFALILGVFLISIYGVMKIWQGIEEETGYAISSAMRAVLAASLIMIVGQFVPDLVSFGSLMLFVLQLGVFLLGISLALLIPKMIFGSYDNIGDTLFNVLKFVTGAALIMIIGGLAMSLISIKDVFRFTLALAIFLTGIAIAMLPLLFLTSILSVGLSTMVDLMKFVVIASAVLLIGGALFMLFPKLAIYSIIFAVVLDLFLLGIMLCFRVINTMNGVMNLMQAAVLMTAIALFTLIAGGVLLFAGYMIARNPWIIGATLVFGLLMIGYLIAMGFVMKLLNVISYAEVLKAVITVAAIGALTYGMAYVFSKTYNMMKDVKWDTLAIDLLCMVGAVVALGVVLAAIGALVSGPVAAALVIGAVVFIGIIYIIDTLVDTFDRLRILTENTKDTDFSNLTNLIEGLSGFLKDVLKIADSFGITDWYNMKVLMWSVNDMCEIISSVGSTIKDFADLKVAIYVGTEKVGYRRLTKRDFTTAGQNVTSIVTIMTKSLMAVYDEHPEWYTNNMFQKIWSGNLQNPLALVITQSIKLGRLISTIANAVKMYANMVVGSDYKLDSNGDYKPTKFTPLTSKDFTNAAQNIQTLIITMTKALMSLYDQHPDWYSINLWEQIKRGTSDHPLGLVISQSSKLGSLISSIAKGIQNFANLRVPDFDAGFDENGQPKKYKKLEDDVFKSATLNISRIVTQITYALMSIYDAHKDWYEEDWWDSTTPVALVIKQSSKIGGLVSNIAKGVQDFANLRIPKKWNDEGKPIDFDPMTNNDFKNAQKNVVDIVTNTTMALMKLYDEHKNWFDEGLFDDSPIAKVFDVAKDLGSMIANLAKGVVDMANMRVAISWDPKTGAATDWTNVTTEHFNKAGENVAKIVTSLVESLSSNKEIFDKLKDDDIEDILDNTKRVADIVSSITQTIKGFAEVNLPIEWDNEGHPIKFRNFATENGIDDIILKATNNVKSVLLSMCTVFSDPLIVDLYTNDNMDKIGDVLDDIKQMAEIFGTVTDLIVNIASMKYPIGPFDKDGKPKSYASLDYTAITKEGGVKDVIKELISLIPQTFIDLTANEVFKPGSNKTQDIMENVIVARIQLMTEVIQSVADAISMYADGQISTLDGKSSNITINQTIIDKMASNIANILTSTVNAIFLPIPGSDKSAYDILLDKSDKDIEKIIGKISVVMKVVNKMGEVIQSIAALQMLEFDENGHPTGNYIKMEPGDFTKAKTNIITIMSTITEAMNELLNDKEKSGWLDNIDDSLFGNWGTNNGHRTHSSNAIANIMNSVYVVVMILSKMQSLITNYAQNRFPYIGDDGKLAYMTVNNKNLQTAKSNMKGVMWAIVNAMDDILNDKVFNETMDNIISNELVEKTKSMLDNIAQALTNFTSSFNTILSGVDMMKPTMDSLLENFSKENNIMNIVYAARNKLVTLLSAMYNIKFALQSTETHKLLSWDDIKESIVNNITNINETIQVFQSQLGLVDASLKTFIKQFNVEDREGVIVKSIATVLALEKLLTYIQNFGSSAVENDASTKNGLSIFKDAMESYVNTLTETGQKMDNKNIKTAKESLEMIKKTVTTINSLNMSKMAQMNKLISNLTAFFNKCGSLDELTKALANDLASVLNKLVVELASAKETIKTTEELQTKRHEMIEKVSKEIRDTFNKHMVVEIIQTQTNDQTPPTTPSPTT